MEEKVTFFWRATNSDKISSMRLANLLYVNFSDSSGSGKGDYKNSERTSLGGDNDHRKKMHMVKWDEVSKSTKA